MYTAVIASDLALSWVVDPSTLVLAEPWGAARNEWRHRQARLGDGVLHAAQGSSMRREAEATEGPPLEARRPRCASRTLDNNLLIPVGGTLGGPPSHRTLFGVHYADER